MLAPKIYPQEKCALIAKRYHLGKGVKPASFQGSPQVHPMRNMRRVTVERLIKKLGLLDYNHEAPLQTVSKTFNKVVLPLKMHIGVPVTPTVKLGDKVKAGQLIGAMPDGKLSAALHASISGTVSSVDDKAIIISKEQGNRT